MRELEARTGRHGHSVYCGVCWEPVYVLWVDADPPDYDRCAIGDYTAQSCPNACAAAQKAALTARAEAEGKTLLQYLMDQAPAARAADL